MKRSTFSIRDRITWLSDNPYTLDKHRKESRELYLEKFKRRDFPYCFLLGSGLIEDCLVSIWWELEGKYLHKDKISCGGTRYESQWYRTDFLYSRGLIDHNTFVLLKDLQRDRNHVSHHSIHNLRFLNTDFEINRFWKLFRVLEDVESNLKNLNPDFDQSRLLQWSGGSL